MHARQYRPDVGRFLSRDLYASAAGDQALQADPLTQNRYAFAGGNPVTNIEFDGHKRADCKFCPATGAEPPAAQRRAERSHQRTQARYSKQYEAGVRRVERQRRVQAVRTQLQKARTQFALGHLDLGCRRSRGIPDSEKGLTPCEAWLETEPGRALQEGAGILVTAGSEVLMGLSDASQGLPAAGRLATGPSAKGGSRILRRLASLFPSRHRYRIGPYDQLRGGVTGEEAHHILQHAAVRELPGYSRGQAPAIGLRGPGSSRSTQHGRTVTEQIDTLLGSTLGDEVTVAADALRRAGVPRRVIRQALTAADRYFYQELGLAPTSATRIPGTRRR